MTTDTTVVSEAQAERKPQRHAAQRGPSARRVFHGRVQEMVLNILPLFCECAGREDQPHRRHRRYRRSSRECAEVILWLAVGSDLAQVAGRDRLWPLRFSKPFFYFRGTRGSGRGGALVVGWQRQTSHGSRDALVADSIDPNSAAAFGSIGPQTPPAPWSGC
jgi:hypothetical protein